MNVAVLTFHYPDNYGAVWQAYALSAALKQLGHEPYLINYNPPDQLPAYKLPVGRFYVTLRMIGFLKRRAAFRRFRRRYLPPTTRLYQTRTDLETNPPVADAYIAGSDQIWNPTLLGGEYDPAYFLNFASNGKRISYAASFGETSKLVPSEQLQAYLSEFDALSVREAEAARLLKEAFDLDVANVCDPVLLLDDYTPFLGQSPCRHDFVFTYNLFRRRNTDDLSMRLGQAIGCQVRRVNDDWKLWKYSSRPEFGISPIRWLNLIHSAKLVLSDSFHATVFSILLRKPFVTVLANPQHKNTNRIVNLLQGLGLDERIVAADDPTDVVIDKSMKSVDWDAVHELIQTSRRDAVQYLVGALRE